MDQRVVGRGANQERDRQDEDPAQQVRGQQDPLAVEAIDEHAREQAHEQRRDGRDHERRGRR